MAPKQILVVDDEPDITTYLSSFLEDNGYTVLCAEDATVALSLLECYVPDLILVDVMMPGRSGLDFLVTVRRDPRLGNIPQAMQTAPIQTLPTGNEFTYRAKFWNKGTLSDEGEERTRTVRAVNIIARQ